MAHVVVMPKLGLTMRMGLVARWLVDVGAHVAEEAPLLEVETDKITTEVGAPAAGVLIRRVDQDVEVPVGEPIAILGDPGEDVSSIALFAPEATP
jgi:pyruvate/2-oxoglutarate dehydrogenase complex dihydrolipoamide acyltransferase (E2) component